LFTLHANRRRLQQLARKFDAELSFQSGSVLGEMKAPRRPIGSRSKACSHPDNRRSAASLIAARAPRAATLPPRRRASLRIFVVRCGLPCEPIATASGGHSTLVNERSLEGNECAATFDIDERSTPGVSHSARDHPIPVTDLGPPENIGGSAYSDHYQCLRGRRDEIPSSGRLRHHLICDRSLQPSEGRRACILGARLRLASARTFAPGVAALAAAHPGYACFSID
jgi:hypothetical protein